MNNSIKQNTCCLVYYPMDELSHRRFHPDGEALSRLPRAQETMESHGRSEIWNWQGVTKKGSKKQRPPVEAVPELLLPPLVDEVAAR